MKHSTDPGTPSPADDLGYVRRALERDARSPFPMGIAVLWAVVCGAGFTLNDLAPQWANLYWAVSAPAGFLASCWLGFRSSRRAGVIDRGQAMPWIRHFGSLLLSAAAVATAAALGALSGAEVGATMVLLTGLAFLLAGVHLSRPLGWVGGLLVAGYPLVLVLDRWRWTSLGVAVAAALLAAGWAGRRRGHDRG